MNHPSLDEQTVTHMATVAARHGHDFEQATHGIRLRPRVWEQVVRDWEAAERLEAAMTRKVARDAAWTPNERQQRVLHLLAAQAEYPIDHDLPMASHLAASTRTLIRHGRVARRVLGDRIAYCVQPAADGSL